VTVTPTTRDRGAGNDGGRAACGEADSCPAGPAHARASAATPTEAATAVSV